MESVDELVLAQCFTPAPPGQDEPPSLDIVLGGGEFQRARVRKAGSGSHAPRCHPLLKHYPGWKWRCNEIHTPLLPMTRCKFKLNLASWNVRGLCDNGWFFRSKCKRLSSYLQQLGRLDICMLKEQKLNSLKMELIKRQAWKGLAFWSEAMGPSGTCGGLALLVGPTLAPFLHSHGADPEGRFLWASFQTPNSQHV